MAKLVYNNQGVAEEFTFEPGRTEFTIGRNPKCDVRINNPSMSRKHAEIRFEPGTGQFILYDLNSSNGTFLNGRRIRSEPISHGDEILCGEFKLFFSNEAAAASAPAPAPAAPDYARGGTAAFSPNLGEPRRGVEPIPGAAHSSPAASSPTSAPPPSTFEPPPSASVPTSRGGTAAFSPNQELASRDVQITGSQTVAPGAGRPHMATPAAGSPSLGSDASPGSISYSPTADHQAIAGPGDPFQIAMAAAASAHSHSAGSGELDAAHARIRDLLAENEQLRATLGGGGRSDELDRLRAALDAARAHNESLDAALAEATARIDSARDVESTFAARVEALERDALVLRAERDDLSARLQAALRDAEEHRRDAGELRVQLQDRDVTIAALDGELRQVPDAAEIERLREDARRVREAYNDLAGELRNLLAANDALRDELSRAQRATRARAGSGGSA